MSTAYATGSDGPEARAVAAPRRRRARSRPGKRARSASRARAKSSARARTASAQLRASGAARTGVVGTAAAVSFAAAPPLDSSRSASFGERAASARTRAPAGPSMCSRSAFARASLEQAARPLAALYSTQLAAPGATARRCSPCVKRSRPRGRSAGERHGRPRQRGGVDQLSNDAAEVKVEGSARLAAGPAPSRTRRACDRLAARAPSAVRSQAAEALTAPRRARRRVDGARRSSTCVAISQRRSRPARPHGSAPARVRASDEPTLVRVFARSRRAPWLESRCQGCAAALRSRAWIPGDGFVLRTACGCRAIPVGRLQAASAPAFTPTAGTHTIPPPPSCASCASCAYAASRTPVEWARRRASRDAAISAAPRAIGRLDRPSRAAVQLARWQVAVLLASRKTTRVPARPVLHHRPDRWGGVRAAAASLRVIAPPCSPLASFGETSASEQMPADAARFSPATILSGTRSAASCCRPGEHARRAAICAARRKACTGLSLRDAARARAGSKRGAPRRSAARRLAHEAREPPRARFSPAGVAARVGSALAVARRDASPSTEVRASRARRKMDGRFPSQRAPRRQRPRLPLRLVGHGAEVVGGEGEAAPTSGNRRDEAGATRLSPCATKTSRSQAPGAAAPRSATRPRRPRAAAA